MRDEYSLSDPLNEGTRDVKIDIAPSIERAQADDAMHDANPQKLEDDYDPHLSASPPLDHGTPVYYLTR
jgi:hypothetical protein